MGRGLAPALHVLVAAQGRLPAVSLAAVPALELATGIVRTVSVSLGVMRFYIGFGVKSIVGVHVDGVHTEAVVNVVVFLRKYYIIGVVVLGVGLGVLLFGGRFIVADILTYRVVVLHERLLEKVGLDVVGDGVEGVEGVEGQFGEVQRRELFGGRLDIGELNGGRHQRQRLRVRVLRGQQRQQRRREAILG